MASLFVVRGRDQGKHFQLAGGVQRIGREVSSDIQLLDHEASRSHAEIRFDPGAGICELVDLGSSNGTLLNGVRVDRRRLRSGDRIEIGGTLLIFTGTGQPAAMEAAHGVDIVFQSQAKDASRIVSSLSSSGRKPNRLTSDSDRSLEVMYLTAIAVGRSDDLDEVLDRILRLVFDWVEADRGCIMLRDPESGQLQPAARCDRDRLSRSAGGNAASERTDGADGDSQRIAISRTILDYVFERKEGVRTSDARDDERFESAASIVSGGVREALCVPLQGRYEIVGALYVDTYTSPGQLIKTGGRQKFTDDHLRLITAIGYQAALAIEDTFYYSALVQSERLATMGKTIATLSHHVKNILQGIRGGSYLIEAGLQRNDTDAIRRGWGIVDRNQERISNLVLDMLSFSKEREPDRIEADLNETVSDVVELMQSRAGEAGIELTAELESSLPLAEFDPDALHRAVLNLVTNAIDAAASGEASVGESTGNDDGSGSVADDAAPVSAEAPRRPRGQVWVRTGYEPAEGWRVDVVDNGPGIAPADREKIFSLFESRKGARGTGLGLPVSAKIMREHGGDITVLDNEAGKGCCFRLSLPPRETHVDELAERETQSGDETQADRGTDTGGASPSPATTR